MDGKGPEPISEALSQGYRRRRNAGGVRVRRSRLSAGSGQHGGDGLSVAANPSRGRTAEGAVRLYSKLDLLLVSASLVCVGGGVSDDGANHRRSRGEI